ncbi:Uncharacterized protein conserved in bacteria [Bordetella ansorpii]|uniref:Uncharacterized protein conserved in bacteria n=1 Tax=Bordetella ansorpii TaxID=288768 RepID=A0A157PM88_9BORD|nr:Uncharacterized protein conserved in bacteria [Bordetella ansorpii]
MRVFKTKGVKRFARHEQISDDDLRTAIERATQGFVDADLGGGLIKQRVARRGQGSSSGFRMIEAYRQSNRAVFLYGFAKNDRGNITGDELRTLRTLGANWLTASATAIATAMNDGDLQEIEYDDYQT